MHLRILHTTRYDFESPVAYGLQQLRTTPKSTRGQSVLNWTTTIEGGKKELEFDDFHRNHVELASFQPGTTFVVIRSEGEVRIEDTQGIVGSHQGDTPLWLFQRTTPLTAAGAGCRTLVRGIKETDPVGRLHALSAAVLDAVRYQTGASDMNWSVEEVLSEGVGVCQDHTHVFLACARRMGVPARYVSGYLMLDDSVSQNAMHAWAEAHVDGLGWIGFDVSNGISPDSRYVRVATGLDYLEAAPVSGTTFGSVGESLSVELQVAEQFQQ